MSWILKTAHKVYVNGTCTCIICCTCFNGGQWRWTFKFNIMHMVLHLCYFCLVYDMLVCTSVNWCLVVTCWERADLFALVCDVKLSLSHWYPGSDAVLDCIDSWYLPLFLVLQNIRYTLCITGSSRSADPESFVKGGPTPLFLIDEGRENPITYKMDINGVSLAVW